MTKIKTQNPKTNYLEHEAKQIKTEGNTEQFKSWMEPAAAAQDLTHINIMANPFGMCRQRLPARTDACTTAQRTRRRRW
jgi:hypothetical protein